MPLLLRLDFCVWRTVWELLLCRSLRLRCSRRWLVKISNWANKQRLSLLPTINISMIIHDLSWYLSVTRSYLRHKIWINLLIKRTTPQDRLVIAVISSRSKPTLSYLIHTNFTKVFLWLKFGCSFHPWWLSLLDLLFRCGLFKPELIIRLDFIYFTRLSNLSGLL